MNENAQKFFFYLLGMAIGLMMPGPVSKEFTEYHAAIKQCEINLSRTQHCKIIAVPATTDNVR